MGLGFFTVAGLAAVVYAIIHHIIVKTSLFLTGGLIGTPAVRADTHRPLGRGRLSRIVACSLSPVGQGCGS
jgi:formate hydrogenlyase subunit 3/multisubunit Na+/H+ antiporter MnhD subunit